MTGKQQQGAIVGLKHGAGGKSMGSLIDSFRDSFSLAGQWQGLRSDAAFIKLGDEFLCFTTDSHIVTPLFYPGGDIGSLSVNGTVNDIAVMGAEPLGLSLSFIMEEGLPRELLDRVVASIARASEETGVPVVTGDTKVMGKGEIDKLAVNTAAVGTTTHILDESLEAGDLIVASGELGNHEAALLAHRFNYDIDIVSDCAPVLLQIREVRHLLKFAKDPTRGGLSSALHELANHNQVHIRLKEETLPFRDEVNKLGEILGLSPMNFASEGRFVCGASPDNVEELLSLLQRHNPRASVIAEVKEKGKAGLTLETEFGALKRVREFDGDTNPRIC